MTRVLLLWIGFLATFSLMAADSLSDQEAHRPTLTGKVLDTNGVPVQGATVFIFSGGPRVGTSSFCPTCYPDCRKKDVTDAKGEFTIESLDPNLLFRLLVVGKGYKPIFVPKIDPLKSPAEVRITPRQSQFPPRQSLRGTVVDPEGRPVPQAVVNFDFFFWADGRGCGGQCEGVDLVAVADEQGRFVIGSEKKFVSMTVSVDAPGFARRKFFRLSSDEEHELKLTVGATVTGRIVKDGKPVKGVGVGLVSEDRSENFTGNFDTFTNEDGRFAFYNVPPFQTYFVYSLMGTGDAPGIASAKKIKVPGDGTTEKVNDLVLETGVRLRGRVRLSDGNPIPPNTRLLYSRETAWDSANVVLDGEGRFDLDKIPRESISLSVRVRGYRFSEKNKSLDLLNGFSLIGKVESDTYVDILLEPGEFKPPNFHNLPQGIDWIPKDKPLQGVTPDAL